jgi:hypothetical protein
VMSKKDGTWLVEAQKKDQRDLTPIDPLPI